MPVRPPDDSQPKTALAVGGSDANEGLYGMDVPEDDEEDLELSGDASGCTIVRGTYG